MASTWLYFRERVAEQKEKEQARQAEASKTEAESLRRSSDNALTFLKRALYSADSYNVRDETLNFEFLFRSAESNLDSIGSDPRATAVAQSALGRIASNWGRYEQAKKWLERSAEFWRELEKSSEPGIRKEAGMELAEVLNYLAWATVGDQENNTNLNERARQGESFAKQAFEKQRELTSPNEDQTLCFQADWLRLRGLAGESDLIVFLAFMDYLAAWAGQSREQFRDSLSAAIVSAVHLADAGNRKEAHQCIREFNEPLFDPKTRPASRIRLPRALANAGQRIRDPSKLPPAVGKFLHLNNHELEVSGALLIEVATQLGPEMLPAGHPDLKAIARLAETSEKKAGL